MIIFTIDTSGRNGTLAIARRDAEGTRVLASESLNGGQYSAELIPKFAAMLNSSGLKKTDVDAIAVVAGPGSFTGLARGFGGGQGVGGDSWEAADRDLRVGIGSRGGEPTERQP